MYVCFGEISLIDYYSVINREHLLHRMLPALTLSRTTTEMYEEKSFLRHKNLQRFLFQILQPLGEFPFNLDSSITSGIAC